MPDKVEKTEVEELKQLFAENLELKEEVKKGIKTAAEAKEAVEQSAKAVDKKFAALELKQKEADEAKDAKIEEFEKAIAKMVPAGENGKELISQKQVDIYNMQLKTVNPSADPITVENAMVIKSAYDKCICNKEALLTAEEKAVVNSIIDPQGGYVTAPVYDQTLINKKFDLRGVLDLISIKNIASGEYMQAVDDADYDSAEYINELANTDPDDHEANYDLVRWSPTEQIFKVDITRTEIEDAYIQGGIENDILGKARLGIIRKTAAQVLVGNGVDRPKGILTYADGTTAQTIEQLTSFASTSISWEDVINIMPSALSDAYHDNASYAMNRTRFFDLLVDKDSNGQLKLMNQINFFNRDGVSMTIMGKPVKFDAGISSATTAATLSVIFGDFKEAYQLVERIGFSVIVDNVTSGQVVTYRIRRRNDGRLRMGRGLKILKLKA